MEWHTKRKMKILPAQDAHFSEIKSNIDLHKQKLREVITQQLKRKF